MGQTLTQSVYLQAMQESVTTKGMSRNALVARRRMNNVSKMTSGNPEELCSSTASPAGF